MNHSPLTLLNAMIAFVVSSLLGCESLPSSIPQLPGGEKATKVLTESAASAVASGKVVDTVGLFLYDFHLKREGKYVSKNKEVTEPVKKIAHRLIDAAKIKYGKTAKGFDWETVVIQKEARESVTVYPGGKIVVYTGMFRPCVDHNGLAAVLAHEMAHALNRHLAKRIDRGLVAAMATGGGVVALKDKLKPEEIASLAAAAGAGYLYGIDMPYARKLELEADRLSLELMREAGYDPNAAREVLQRLQERPKPDGSKPEFLASHPVPQSRIQELNHLLESKYAGLRVRPVDDGNELLPDVRKA
jgi:predicted Zn-dependent protease